MSSDTSICYNKGCGKTFTLSENKEDSCTYHPGAPIFHDAYKSWSCCKKKSTDFTTFLNTKGCAVGPHNSIKPPEPVKPTLENDEDVIIVQAPQPAQTTRPSYDLPMKTLPATIAQSLKKALENKNKVNTEENEEKKPVISTDEVSLGESCKNNSCTAAYNGDFSNLENCTYHPGVPIFHEGLKYWSCCKKKASDFNQFLEQKGCTVGRHIWIKKNHKKIVCRHDWHQTGTHVTVAVYAKHSQPDLTFVKINPIRLNAHIIFGEDECFDLDIELKGVVDDTKCTVTMYESKVEVVMRKADATTWPYLNIEQKIKTDEETKKDEEEICEEMETVDLGDII